MLCHCDYAEILVASFSHQIQSEYYGGNKYVFIEGIALELFSATTEIETATTQYTHTRHAVFRYFLYYDSKKYAVTTTAHRKNIIELMKQLNILYDTLSTLW